MEGGPFQNLKLTFNREVIRFEPRTSPNLAHRDFQEGSVQGTALAAFPNLGVKKGDRILVFPKSTTLCTEGWVLAQKGQDDGVEIGWIPSNCYELANTTSSSSFFNSESGHAPESLVRLAEGLKGGRPLASDDRCRRDHLDSSSFVVKKVWFNLKPSEGYFGIYWFCTTASSHFRLHCTIAEWDVEHWAAKSMVKFNTERVDFNKLKAAFDKWVRGHDISARLLFWRALDVHKLVARERHISGWRIIMELRISKLNRKLYDIRKDFENLYELKDCNAAGPIHYSLDQQT